MKRGMQLVITDCVENKSDKQKTNQNGTSRDDESRPSTAQLTNSNEGQCASADFVHDTKSGPADPL